MKFPLIFPKSLPFFQKFAKISPFLPNFFFSPEQISTRCSPEQYYLPRARLSKIVSPEQISMRFSPACVSAQSKGNHAFRRNLTHFDAFHFILSFILSFRVTDTPQSNFASPEQIHVLLPRARLFPQSKLARVAPPEQDCFPRAN